MRENYQSKRGKQELDKVTMIEHENNNKHAVIRDKCVETQHSY